MTQIQVATPFGFSSLSQTPQKMKKSPFQLKTSQKDVNFTTKDSKSPTFLSKHLPLNGRKEAIRSVIESTFIIIDDNTDCSLVLNSRKIKMLFGLHSTFRIHIQLCYDIWITSWLIRNETITILLLIRNRLDDLLEGWIFRF